ncbi:MAG: DUF4065 domain-containing protein [Hyphomicrobiales bacterium]|nr:DUF4065 domain-containing protein [Hyphomicrobiales bacterium]MDE2113715.1 SocA family protein [Hyphomicrobiales bacterium]
MSATPYDPKIICNVMLDEAAHQGLVVTNLALQKLLYFAHAHHLIETKQPLVQGYFEAWQYGPVHPAAYKAFKAAGNRPINFKAERQEPLSGRMQPIADEVSATVRHLVVRVITSYGRLTPGRLVEISHARDAPWHFVVDTARTSMAFGLRISDSAILERFKFHKVSVGAEPLAGEPIEDSPFA